MPRLTALTVSLGLNSEHGVEACNAPCYISRWVLLPSLEAQLEVMK